MISFVYDELRFVSSSSSFLLSFQPLIQGSNELTTLSITPFLSIILVDTRKNPVQNRIKLICKFEVDLFSAANGKSRLGQTGTRVPITRVTRFDTHYPLPVFLIPG